MAYLPNQYGRKQTQTISNSWMSFMSNNNDTFGSYELHDPTGAFCVFFKMAARENSKQ